MTEHILQDAPAGSNANVPDYRNDPSGFQAWAMAQDVDGFPGVPWAACGWLQCSDSCSYPAAGITPRSFVLVYQHSPALAGSLAVFVEHDQPVIRRVEQGEETAPTLAGTILQHMTYFDDLATLPPPAQWEPLGGPESTHRRHWLYKEAPAD